MENLKINIVSDVMCPWCIIGYQNLATALDELQGELSADIQWHAFELNPDMPTEGQNLLEHLQEKYNLTAEQMLENRQRVEQMGTASGFEFNFTDDSLMFNSFDCHRLLTWAQIEGKQTALKLALFKAYFTDQVLLNNPEELLKVVESVGLDRNKASEILAGNEFANNVRDEESSMHRMGISSVPTFIINDKYAINGGQSVATFKQALVDISTQEKDELVK